MKRTISILTAAFLLLNCASIAESADAFTSLKDSSDNLIGNIELACEALNETVLYYGDVFSFNELVGPRTESRGYRAAINGRGVSVTGGGVAQAASAIYMALRNTGADVTYTDRYTYGARFEGTYVKDSSDAILVDYSSGIDFSFVCNEDQLEIDLWIENDQLCCDIQIQDYASCEYAESEIYEYDTAPNSFYEDDTPLGVNESYPELNFGEYSFVATVSYPVSSASIDLSKTESDVLNNITQAAASINGTVLAPGESFSFNSTVGPRTERYGFVSAVNGRGVRVVGGGVAQTASVLWLAVKDMDDISIVSRSTYGSNYNQKYVSSANDAILTDYSGSIDFVIKNTGDRYLTISMYIQDRTLICDITE